LDKCRNCDFYEPAEQWCDREDKLAIEVYESCPFEEFPTDAETSLVDLTAQTEFDKLAEKSGPLNEKEIREAAIKVMMAQGKTREEAEKEMKAWERSAKRSKS
jgi:hypothetical protein